MHNRMQARLAQLRAERADNADKGFTLIELLVVVVIIGILIAIAIPLYLHFENGSKNSSAESDVHNAVAVVQQCISDNDGALPGAPTGNGVQDNNLVFTCGTQDETATVSKGNTLKFIPNGSDYQITGENADAQVLYTYDSSTGKTTH